MPELFTEPPVEGGRPSHVSGGLWARRVILTLFAVWIALALADVFGQHASTSTAAGSAASLTLTAPRVVRGGLLFQSKLEIHVRRTINNPRLVLGDGWLEGMQVNSIEPQAASESSRDGHVLLSYNQLVPGDVLRIWLQFQVNPTEVGTHDYRVELDDAKTPVAAVDRTLRVLP